MSSGERYSYGWVCPKCGAVMSPFMNHCINCTGNHPKVEVPPVQASISDKEKVPFTCQWSFQKGNDVFEIWQTSCGYEVTVDEGGPSANHVLQCPHCKRWVEEVESPSDKGASDKTVYYCRDNGNIDIEFDPDNRVFIFNVDLYKSNEERYAVSVYDIREALRIYDYFYSTGIG